MRLILTFIFIAFGTISNCQTDWSVNNDFNGKIKTLKTISYTESRGMKAWNQSDSIANYNIIDSKIVFFDTESTPLKHSWIRNQDTVGYCLWSYDSKGRIIKQTDYRQNNTLERTIRYEYPKETLTIKKFFDKYGKLHSTWKKEIDSTKKVIRNFEIIDKEKDDEYITILNDFYLPKKRYSIDSTQNSEYYYNNKKRLLSEKFWNKDSSSFTHQTFIYNKKGQIIETKYLDNKGKLLRLENKHYDKFGNVIQILTYFPNSSLSTHSERIDYIYDKQGNWTSKKTYIEDNLLKNYETSKFIREIEYY